MLPISCSTKVTIHTCIEQLQAGYRNIYGNLNTEYENLIARVAYIALTTIATSNAPYHDVEHTILVALVGQEILRGKYIREGRVSPEDWLHCIISLLCHDIGYVKGVCNQDRVEVGFFATGIQYERISLSSDSTDASLAPFHVDRGKLFVEEYFGDRSLIDVQVIKRNIELTRFPVPADEEHQDTVNYPGLVRAADLIGQLGDPQYLQKMTALFREFEEVGVHKKLGYHNPGDLRTGYPNFFWNVVYPYIQDGLRYLEATRSGQNIIASLYRNVFEVEAELLGTFPKPQADPDRVQSQLERTVLLHSNRGICDRALQPISPSLNLPGLEGRNSQRAMAMPTFAHQLPASSRQFCQSVA